jgi:ribosomal-protein-alanine N-acetyltransferase
MSEADVDVVAGWRYPGEYAFYDWGADPDDLAELRDREVREAELVAVDDASGELIGFFQFKRPHRPALEVGLGLRPDQTGHGLGLRFVEAGLDEARRRFAPDELVLAVAAFNRRAITVYERAGFTLARRYIHHVAGADWEFLELRRPGRGTAGRPARAGSRSAG